MAKRTAKSRGAGGTNKSLAIREYLKQNPDAGPTAVASALNSREGWNISAAYVSTIKNKLKPSGRKTRSSGMAKGTSLNQESLIQAYELCKRAGGINQAKAALDLLAKLTS